MVEEALLAPEAAGVAVERAVGVDHAVTRDDERDHVRAVGAADGARGLRHADAGRHLGDERSLATTGT